MRQKEKKKKKESEKKRKKERKRCNLDKKISKRKILQHISKQIEDKWK